MHTLAQLAELLDNATVIGDGNTGISGICSIGNPRPGCITFAGSDKWLRQVSGTSAAAVIVARDPGVNGVNLIIHPHPYLAFVTIVNHLYAKPPNFTGVHSTAVIDGEAAIASPVSIGPAASVGPGSTVAKETILAAGVRIGSNVTIGKRCHLHPNVVIEDGCTIGDDVIIHAGTVIGADGFGYIQHEGRNVKVPQTGVVRIGNQVEIGANCCIDRGTIDDTVLGDGVVLDNLVQIGHNVVIGDHAVIVAQVGLAGSARVGPRAILGGKAGATEGVEIGEGAILAAQAIATRTIEPGTMHAGNPAIEIEIWRKSRVIQRRLPAVWSKLQKIIKESK